MITENNSAEDSSTLSKTNQDKNTKNKKVKDSSVAVKKIVPPRKQKLAVNETNIWKLIMDFQKQYILYDKYIKRSISDSYSVDILNNCKEALNYFSKSYNSTNKNKYRLNNAESVVFNIKKIMLNIDILYETEVLRQKQYMTLKKLIEKINNHISRWRSYVAKKNKEVCTVEANDNSSIIVCSVDTSTLCSSLTTKDDVLNELKHNVVIPLF